MTVRASLTVFFGFVFHDEEEDDPSVDHIWAPIVADVVHCTEEAVVAAGEMLGAKPPSVKFNNRDPEVMKTYEAWWADCKARVEAAGCTFVTFGDCTNGELMWGLAIAESVAETESWQPTLALSPDYFEVDATWSATLRRFCDAVGIEYREPQWVIAASD